MIVRLPSPYNSIIGTPGIREIQAVPSMAHRMLKFPVNGRVVTICSTILTPNECATITATSKDYMKKIEGDDTMHAPEEESRYICMAAVRHDREAELLRDIEETFHTLRKINMKLNPKKCTFEAVEGMFLGYMIGPEGIKPCPEKIEVVLQLPSPRTVKEVQSLNGKLASLNRFLSKSAEKSLPLFKTLKKCVKKSDFRWTLEAEQAFKQLNQHILELLMLVALRPKEELIMYLSASQGAVGAVLMTERDSIQTSVYFVSRALQVPELNYTPMGKLVLALVFATKRLRRYFQAHPITLITDQLIKQVMSRPEVAGRLQKWSIMLGEHNITYRPRTSVKGQILADFLVEKPEEASADMSEKETPQEPWTLFTDGSSCIDGSGAGLILTSLEGAEFTYALRFQFTASNNEAEYEALLAGLRIAAQMRVRHIRVSVDSKLVANQVLGTYIAKEENMIKYLDMVKSLVSRFSSFSISQVLRSQNKKVDALRKIASTSFAHLSKQVLVEVLPDNKKEASKLRIKARQYELMDRILYRRSFLRSWLRDARDMILKWKDCQVHRPVPRNPQQPLTPIMSSWPFYKWGIDIAGPFPEGPGKAHRTMIKSSNGDTPFSLTCGTEAVIPAEIRMPTYRTATVDIVRNDDEFRLNLDLLEERRERAAICDAKEKLKMMRYYNVRVCGVTFKPRDYVYRSNEASHAMDGGKLGPKWEGPYEVTEVLGGGAYKLRSMDGAVLPRTWNIANLKKCYL
ncbi:reverse transcriptase domain-containing protein [Tanacetum coccineum]